MQRYQRQQLVTRLPHSIAEIKDAFNAVGLPTTTNDNSDLWLYALGVVGTEIAKARREDAIPLTGYLGAELQRVMHDVLCNETVLRLCAFAETRGWRPFWHSKYEATVRDDKDKQIVEPDSMVVLKRGSKSAYFLIEFHNEDRATRAEQKVKRYEDVYATSHWRDAWETNTFPPVLAVFGQKIVGDGYIAATKGKQLHCTYFGKTLEKTLAGELGEWWNYNAKKRESILPTIDK